MEESRMPDEPTQQTPQGQTIPVPSRDDVLRDLRKAAKADQSDTGAGSAGEE